ncbi:hypothetical protein ACFV2H_18245 [Streptomyces sp. NPDC059629]|uniref:hypothetical protein n=1 Tax=Streptomyces sp. NPDC059629 TaxID=3346889 RepID=UPI0036AB770E
MIRRMAAAVLLLAAVVLLHVTTPHGTGVPASTPSAVASAARTGPQASYDVASAVPQSGSGAVHAGTAADSPARPQRADHLVEPPLPAAFASAVEAAVALDDTLPRTARPRTVRDVRSPGDAAVLQTFRC